jgi:hypothetical protein
MAVLNFFSLDGEYTSKVSIRDATTQYEIEKYAVAMFCVCQDCYEEIAGLGIVKGSIKNSSLLKIDCCGWMDGKIDR